MFATHCVLKGLEMSVAYCNQKSQNYFFPFLPSFLCIYLPTYLSVFYANVEMYSFIIYS